MCEYTEVQFSVSFEQKYQWTVDWVVSLKSVRVLNFQCVIAPLKVRPFHKVQGL